MKIQIQPIAIAFQQDANFIQLRQGGYILGTNEQCRVRVLFYNNNDFINDQTIIDIPQELVEDWTDNQILIDYAIETLGLTIVEQNLII